MIRLIPRPKIPLRIHRSASEGRKIKKVYLTIPFVGKALKTENTGFFKHKIQFIAFVAAVLLLGVNTPLYGRADRVPQNKLAISIGERSSTVSNIFSHIALSAGGAGTWGATNGATLLVKREDQVIYTGSNPSREFDRTDGWASNYTSLYGFFGVKFSWLAAGAEFESFKAVPEEDRFTAENTAYGIAVSLPTVNLKGTVLSARAEIRIAPHGPLSPYVAVSYPLSHSLKSLSYNSDPSPVEVKNEAWTIYGVKVSPYENTELSAKFYPAFELGFGVRIKGAFRLRLSARYRRLEWNLFYHKHQDEVIQFGANLAL